VTVLRGLTPVAAALVLASCGGSEPDGTTTTAGPEAARPSASEGRAEAQLYFTAGEQFHKVERKLGGNGSKLERAAAALIEGPTRAERRGDDGAQTQIPSDAELADVALASDGTAVVKVSSAFMAGVPRNAAQRTRAEQADLDARVGQVAYTLTQFEPVRAAKVVAGGRPVEAAVERDDYAKPNGGPRPIAHRRGSRQPGVRELQQRLAKLHFLPAKAVDGVDGYRTEQAVIAFQAWNGLERDGIVGPATTAALERAKRPRPGKRGPDRRVEVYRDKGVALLITHGRTKRAIHVSAGAPSTPTPAGRYEVFRKELRSWSVPFSVWLPYASYFNQGIAFHEYADVPPFAASHGCVRVPTPEAKGVYRFAKVGTTVVVR
jgi:lipoprotein-anchoring transpeptidase ErfK/SrfK